MKVDHIAFGILLCVLVMTNIYAAGSREFDLAVDAYKRGDYAIARIYFENLLDDGGNREFFPDAVYYLFMIHNREGDFVGFLSSASRFLERYSYDSRANEVITLLVRELVERSAYLVAYEYVLKYDFLISDLPALEELGRRLLDHGEPASAGYILSFCGQTDTIKILRAMAKSDLHERVKILESLDGMTRDLYLTENLLLMGDTVNAFLSFRKISGDRFQGDAFYRYTKIALLFAGSDISRHIKRLGTMNGFDRKADLLYALVRVQPLPRFLPEDDDERSLFVQIFSLDTISRAPPQDVPVDSILQYAEDTLSRIRELRGKFRNNYYLDSLYCQHLMARGEYEQAKKVIAGYLRYKNAEPYARKVMGFHQFAEGDYESAAKNIILSNYRSPAVTYVLAECLRFMGQGVTDLYADIATQTADSLLLRKAVRGYLLESYRAESYGDILSVDITELAGDTALVRIYARSLARSGNMARADSLFHAYLQETDDQLLNLYGEYLISAKQYRRARAYYDSIIQHTATEPVEGLYYNWAMTSFLNNEMDTALYRFRYYVSNFRRGDHFYDALFKIATLNYLKEEYDSAGHYYGLACEDVALTSDAMQNQLISYKKAGNWRMVINTGEKMLAMVSDEEQADVHFEIGYAFLRAGRPHEAIENLKVAVRAKAEPSYYYWLGEAYLGKGDFTRAFHSYQKIADIFPDDEMWAPTARYKTGITLELLDEIEAAKKVYEQIIRERGISDPIAAEANLRLEHLEP
ncbi:MAG: tetratricopeptide repeat protein [candidate division WOR-3 bacterium]|nr:tetratricopeptide repeat protein [candidate division WOR-3 bacterium]